MGIKIWGTDISKMYVWVDVSWWQPWANTLAYYPLESDANDYSWNNNNWTNYGVTFSNVWGVDCAVFTSSSTKILLPWLWSFTNLTMSAWFKTTASYSGSTILMLAPSSDDKNIDLSINNWTARLSRYTWYSYNITDGTVNNWVWHNMIGTYTSTWWTKLYVDWVYIGSDSTNTQVKSDNWYSAIWWHPWGYSWATFDWNISNVIIETVEWTAQEVSDYFDLTKGDYLS